jgi:hypothetical protein
MPISTPDDGNVACKSCGATFPPETFPQDQLDRLVDRRDYLGLFQEMRLLTRTKALFDAHPDARRVVESIQRRTMDAIFSGGEADVEEDGERSAEDDQFDRFMEGDPELKGFLKGTTFLLEPRLAFVEGRLADLEGRVDRPAPACPRCGEDALEFVDPLDD